MGWAAENKDQLKFELIKIWEFRLSDKNFWLCNWGRKCSISRGAARIVGTKNFTFPLNFKDTNIKRWWQILAANGLLAGWHSGPTSPALTYIPIIIVRFQALKKRLMTLSHPFDQLVLFWHLCWHLIQEKNVDTTSEPKHTNVFGIENRAGQV